MKAEEGEIPGIDIAGCNWRQIDKRRNECRNVINTAIIGQVVSTPVKKRKKLSLSRAAKKKCPKAHTLRRSCLTQQNKPQAEVACFGDSHRNMMARMSWSGENLRY